MDLSSLEPPGTGQSPRPSPFPKTMASFASPHPRPQWPRAAADAASRALAAAVFAFLDVLDALLCIVYALLDGVLEESPVRCYCHRSHGAAEEEDEELSDTLYVRRSAVRDALVGLLRRLLVVVVGRRRREPCGDKWRSPRWSDCACEACVAWRGSGGRLHVVVKEPAAADDDCIKDADAHAHAAGETDNAIFLHGFSSSSSFWAETVFREASITNCSRLRLLAVDLLGFGQSPKPGDCLYRLSDHVEAIERSLIQPLGLTSFHLVSHSMGCVVALALAAKHPARVKSITLVAPPYFLPRGQKKAMSQVALNRLAEKKLWPPLLFGSAVMSWYEHVGRTVCLVVCKNHRLWERLFSLVVTWWSWRERDRGGGGGGVGLRLLRDLTRHTHHSAWHTMHNVICGGARLQDANLEAVQAAGIPVQAIHGVDDRVVPVECSTRHLKAKLPTARIRVMDGCDHTTVVLGRERDLADELRAFWYGQLN
ncbi:hypothetical protein U9M48_016245 [Paspalum notatum var. saurae]|uniref:AB hydrolase-1 domain-containing protein n=1 Tax=Paspalum notatum var. saurae TaxID=547442 RepID=A0AAQ3WMW2_PASNO